jgi:hypothetical protein
MVPQAYKTPEAILIAVLFGRELGFSPLRSLYMISVIQGAPTINAMGMKALALSKGGRIKTIHWDLTSCVLCGIRGEWEEEVEYTWKDAEIAGLVGKDNWRKNPRAMLYARAVSIVCRNQWSDLLGGIYSTEEMIDTYGPEPKDNVTPEVMSSSLTDDALDKIVKRQKEKEVIQSGNPVWESYEFRYHLPTKKAGWNMEQVREQLKQKGFYFNGEDKHWYGNLEFKQLEQYLRPLNKEPEAPAEELPRLEDIPFSYAEEEVNV